MKLCFARHPEWSPPNARLVSTGDVNMSVRNEGLILQCDVCQKSRVQFIFKADRHPRLHIAVLTFLCAQLLGWLSEKLPAHKTLPPELRDCALPVLSCLEDRSGDVRKKAQEAIVPFMIHVGYNTFVKAAGKLKVRTNGDVLWTWQEEMWGTSTGAGMTFMSAVIRTENADVDITKRDMTYSGFWA